MVPQALAVVTWFRWFSSAAAVLVSLMRTWQRTGGKDKWLDLARKAGGEGSRALASVFWVIERWLIEGCRPSGAAMTAWKHAWGVGHGKASWVNKNGAWAFSHVRDVHGFLARGFGRTSVRSFSYHFYVFFSPF